MAIEHQQTITVEEYFRLEENDLDTRYEYIDGHVYAMAGGTANHDTIKIKHSTHPLESSPWEPMSRLQF